MKLRPYLRLLAPVVIAAAGLGCSQIPVTMHTESHIQHADGTVEHKSSDWHGTLDQLPAQLGKAGKELGDVTMQMAKELTDVPPPGKIELKDISPGLAKYQGKRGVDFLSTAKDDKGHPITFQYVRLGVPQYDEFFKTAQEIYALIYQTTQVVSQMKQMASKLLDTKVDANAELKAQVDKAMGKGEAEASIVADLKLMVDMAQSLAVVVPALVEKIGKLVQTGEALVAGAAASITNPKVVTHLDLVKTGLVSSVKVIKESGSLAVDFSKSLAGFKS
jgi:hypothetical protein